MYLQYVLNSVLYICKGALSMNILKGKYTEARIYASIIEDEALEQIQNMIDSEFTYGSSVAIMPDTHAGAGCTIGTTMTLKDRVVPDIVGVDIGCGMLTIELGKIDIDMSKFDETVHNKVPSGRDIHSFIPVDSYGNEFVDISELRCFSKIGNIDRVRHSMGTLGSGNHFIELDRNSDNETFLVIHTGSRNLGVQVAEYYQKVAEKLHAGGKYRLNDKKKEIIEVYKRNGREKEIQQALNELAMNYKSTSTTDDLYYLYGEEFDNYIHDMKICQKFASENRKFIANSIISTMFNSKLENYNWFETIHNYIDMENMILRKGAVSAQKGEMLLIPINMKEGSLICEGLGNREWNYSAPHGAGRLMSRSEARKNLNMDDYQKSMNGIYSTCVNESTIDESPMAYKPIEVILEDIKDTVRIVDIIKPIYNFKASE